MCGQALLLAPGKVGEGPFAQVQKGIDMRGGSEGKASGR